MSNNILRLYAKGCKRGLAALRVQLLDNFNEPGRMSKDFIRSASLLQKAVLVQFGRLLVLTRRRP